MKKYMILMAAIIFGFQSSSYLHGHGTCVVVPGSGTVILSNSPYFGSPKAEFLGTVGGLSIFGGMLLGISGIVDICKGMDDANSAKNTSKGITKLTCATVLAALGVCALQAAQQ